MANVTELSAEQIAALTAAKRGSSEYKDLLDQFVASESRGIDITESFPGKKLINLANSFKRLVNRHTEYSGVTVLHVTQNGVETLALVKSS